VTTVAIAVVTGLQVNKGEEGRRGVGGKQVDEEEDDKEEL